MGISSGDDIICDRHLNWCGSSNKMKILISGGHLTPALAFLDYALLQKQEVVFVDEFCPKTKSTVKS